MKPESENTSANRSLRETFAILVIWVAFCTWVVGYALAYAYATDDTPIETVFGFPGWVFWGLFVPWLTATSVTIVFCICFVRDDHGEGDADV